MVRRCLIKGNTKAHHQNTWISQIFLFYLIYSASVHSFILLFFFFNTEVSLCISLPSLFYIFVPVSHIADVLTASTASYGLEGKCIALMLRTGVSAYFCFAVVAGGLSMLHFDHFSTLKHSNIYIYLYTWTLQSNLKAKWFVFTPRFRLPLQNN